MINVIREDESGQLLAEFEAGGIDYRLLELAPSHSACLRFIDPYGDLVVNQLQMPVLIGELQGIHDHCNEPDLRVHIVSLIRFIRESMLEPHVYVRFLGD